VHQHGDRAHIYRDNDIIVDCDVASIALMSRSIQLPTNGASDYREPRSLEMDVKQCIKQAISICLYAPTIRLVLFYLCMKQLHNSTLQSTWLRTECLAYKSANNSLNCSTIPQCHSHYLICYQRMHIYININNQVKHHRQDMLFNSCV
jgi:hypothetical protein